MKNISVMVSGGGTNLQAVIDSVKDGRIPDARIALVLSSRDGVYSLERARKAGIRTVVISKDEYPDEEAKTVAILAALTEAQTDLVVMAGYMSILSPRVPQAYAGRIINIHPALLPRHGGPGYYGLHVHEAVIAAGDTESGATVHYVTDGEVDSGEIIRQERVPVLAGDTPETLQQRVLTVEHRILPEAAALVLQKLFR
ncbi:MAG: phosphoribosylglycinamide formyltransferase [Clostridiales Family XIII bacterium]|jgi:phosphoribosylglycinamide formyltransferase-1|nr:phosphoribosylglycinamide formyltransferase [Clostridiales Family XIII bacterium]